MVFDLRIIAREEIKDIPVYSAGLDIEDVKRKYGVERVIKLASNENPLGPSPLAVEAVRSALSDISLYPDGNCTELRRKLAGMLGVQLENLVFGNGTDEIIDFIFYAFFDPGDRAVMGDPTFSSYYLSGMTMGAEMVYVRLLDHQHEVEQMLKTVDRRTKGLFVGTPHNPTGTICSREELEMALDSLPPDVLLVWDEAYREYVEDPSYPESVPYLQRHPNLIVLRTFSKIYGLAGLRIGYGIADPGVVDLLERVRPPFNVNRLAQVAALAALDDAQHVENSRRVNSEGKRYLTDELLKLGMRPVSTQANFILFSYKDMIDGLPERLLEKGVIVRDGAQLGYPGYIRLTIGTPEQNSEVVSVIRDLIG
ncbi:MAG: histidinol-phosphate transaminase [Actinobacteria bacterium]|nr:histidinol-phosphate transaminase [Actinomycetota bacterium]